MNNNNMRCVVTGLGLITAIGNDVEKCWENALAGKSGIDKVKSVDSTDCYADLGAELECDELDRAKYSSDMDRVSKLCVKAAGEAITDAKLKIGENTSADRVGVIMGSCVGGVVSIENYVKNGEDPEDIKKFTISAIANHVAAEFGAGGIVTNVANACAAGTISIAYACELIRAGVADAFIVGGADAFAAVPYSGFIALHALDSSPCSPFNHSHGITLGEGSGALIVESYEHAIARGAKIYCDVLGAGISSDAHHITAPRPDGEGQMTAIRTALKNSSLAPSDISYINAHGTGTPKNDEAEFLSLHTIFDGNNDDLSVSSTKAMVGHCLGAAGAIEAVFTVKALTEGCVPPTVGYSDEDIEALKEKAGNIDFRPNTMRRKDNMRSAMSNSFAFGGNNASIIFSLDGDKASCENSSEKVYITGLGAVTPLGNGISNYASSIETAPAAEGSLCSSVGSEDYAAHGLALSFYRKLDRFSQLQAVSGMEAIENAGIKVTDENANDIGMIIGTANGPISTVYNFECDIAEKGNYAGSAFKFPNTVYNAAGGYLSICSGIKGYNVTLTNGAQSGLASLCYAYNVIHQNGEKIMLATGTDENNETISSLYGKLGCTSEAPTAPYSGSNSFVLGDGSVTAVLESESSAASRGAKRYAEFAGYGMAHASVRFGHIAGSDKALSDAITLALKDADVAADDIDCIVGFGNGMEAFDSIERNVYSDIFGEAEVPVISVKEKCGEGRAASATLGAAHASLILSGAVSRTQKCYYLSKNAVKTQETDVSSFKNILVTACAVGGSYCAVVLRKAN